MPHYHERFVRFSWWITQKHLKSFIDEEIYTALYSYDARTEDDLAFQQGDLLIILDNTRGAWWLAKHKNPPPSGYPHTQRSQGYIPSNYVARLNSNESFSWFVGQYPRQAAERDLNMAQNPYGAFLIRESESRQGDYSLSVKVKRFKSDSNM